MVEGGVGWGERDAENCYILCFFSGLPEPSPCLPASLTLVPVEVFPTHPHLTQGPPPAREGQVLLLLEPSACPRAEEAVSGGVGTPHMAHSRPGL